MIDYPDIITVSRPAAYVERPTWENIMAVRTFSLERKVVALVGLSKL